MIAMLISKHVRQTVACQLSRYFGRMGLSGINAVPLSSTCCAPLRRAWLRWLETGSKLWTFLDNSFIVETKEVVTGSKRSATGRYQEAFGFGQLSVCDSIEVSYSYSFNAACYCLTKIGCKQLSRYRDDGRWPHNSLSILVVINNQTFFNT